MLPQLYQYLQHMFPLLFKMKQQMGVILEPWDVIVLGEMDVILVLLANCQLLFVLRNQMHQMDTLFSGYSLLQLSALCL